MISAPPERRLLATLFALLLSAPALFTAAVADEDAPLYDTVISGGTVMDPESGLVEELDVGIRDGVVAALSKGPLRGRRVLDAAGLVVAPGFIDIQSYGPYYTMSLFKAADGVTTSLTLHGGTIDFGIWAAEKGRGGQMLNYGSAVSHHFLRSAVGVPDRYTAATAAQTARMVEKVEAAMAAGALGVSFSLEYTPGATYEEIRPLCAVAARYKAPCFMHLRYSDPDPPGTNREAVAEALRLARDTGASVHIHHITSTGGTFTMDETAAQIEAARADGLDVTACVYPYTYWATYLSSARFDPGWRRRFRIDYGDLQISGSGERLDEDSFRRYRRSDKLAVAYAIPEADVLRALAAPWVMIGSDGLIKSNGNSHPRGAGCFSRTIGVYVREKGALTLMEALSKMTVEPARLLEGVAPRMKRKGRLRVGMDADIVVFDAARIRDRATVERPMSYSEGIEYVLINGVLVRDGADVRYEKAGVLIRGAGGPGTP